MTVYGEDNHFLSNAQAKALDTALAKPPSRPTIIARKPMPRPIRPIEAAIFLAALGLHR